MLCMRSAIQRHFHEQNDAPGLAALLSVHAATAGMTRRHAAKFFYQICGKLLCSLNMEPLLVTTIQYLLRMPVWLSACQMASL